MAVGHLTYLDLTIEKRQRAAEKIRARLRETLASPHLEESYRRTLLAEMDRISKWERGEISIEP